MEPEAPLFAAPSVPPVVGALGLSRAQLAKQLAVQVLGEHGSTQTRQAAVDALRENALLAAGTDRAQAIQATAALSILVSVVPRLRGGGELSEDLASDLCLKLGLLAADRATEAAAVSSSTHTPAQAYEVAGLLRAMVRLSHSGRVDLQSVPGLDFALLDVVQAHPRAVHPGVLCETLSPNSPKVAALVHASIIAHGSLSKPSALPRNVLQGVFAALNEGRVSSREVASGVPDWTTAIRALPEAAIEGLAASTLMHPGLSANDAGKLCAAICRPQNPRVDQRATAALTAAIDTLRSRLDAITPDDVPSASVAQTIVAEGSQLRRVSTLLGLRTLAGAAGQGDEAADALASEILRTTILEPASAELPQVSVAALAANLPAAREDAAPVAPMPPGDLIPWRLVSALTRVTSAMGEAGRWAATIRDRWHSLDPDLDRSRAWKTLTLAMDLLVSQRPRSEVSAMMNQLLRRGVQEGNVPLEDHQARLEEDLARVSSRALALPFELGADSTALQVSFVPGWRFGVSLEQMERARQDNEWQPSHADRWLDPEAVAVFGNGELCGWLKADEKRNTLLLHSKPTTPRDHTGGVDEQGQSTLDAVLTAVALTVGAEAGMAVEGPALAASLGVIGQLSDNGQLAGWQSNRASVSETARLAASAGWTGLEPTLSVFEPASPQETVRDEETEEVEATPGFEEVEEPDRDRHFPPNPSTSGRRRRS